MPDQVDGLPVHVLLVHAVVVLVPLCAALLVAAACSETVRTRLGVALPALAALCVVLVPVTTEAGEHLERLVGSSPLVEAHAELGEGLLPWTVGLLVLSLFVAARSRWLGQKRAPQPPAESLDAPTGGSTLLAPHRAAQTTALPALRVAVAVLSLLVAAGAVVQVVRTGESGARAVWSGVVDSAAS